MAEAIETNAKLVQVADLVNMATKNDTLYPRKAAVTAEIEEKIGAQIGAVYKPAGSVASADDLPALTVENCGKVVNVTAEITTTEDFVEGAGNTLPAGTNVAVVAGDDEGTFKYDALSGIVDLTSYAKTEEVADDLEKKVDKLEGMGLSTNDYSNADKAKLDSLVIASSAEVDAVINAALGITTGGGEEQGGSED